MATKPNLNKIRLGNLIENIVEFTNRVVLSNGKFPIEFKKSLIRLKEHPTDGFSQSNFLENMSFSVIEYMDYDSTEFKTFEKIFQNKNDLEKLKQTVQLAWKDKLYPIELFPNALPKMMFWRDANNFVDSLGDGWRLPTIYEAEYLQMTGFFKKQTVYCYSMPENKKDGAWLTSYIRGDMGGHNNFVVYPVRDKIVVDPNKPKITQKDLVDILNDFKRTISGYADAYYDAEEDESSNEAYLSVRHLGRWIHDEGNEQEEDDDNEVWAPGEYTKYYKMFLEFVGKYKIGKYLDVDIQTCEKNYCYFQLAIKK